MASIEALLGMNTGAAADLPALARQLRGQQDLGNLLSLSTIPGVAALGASERSGAESAARRGGVLSQAAAAAAENKRRYESQVGRDAEQLTYTRQEDAARRALDAEQQDYDRGTLGEVETWLDGYGEKVFLQQRADGVMVDASDGNEVLFDSDWTRVPDPVAASDTRPLKDVDQFDNNIQTLQDKNGNWATVFSDTREPWDRDEALERSKGRLAQRQSSAAAKAFGGATGTSFITRADAAEKAYGRTDETIASYNQALGALDANAWTGELARLTPDFRAAARDLSQARGRLAMAAIENYTFGSLSEPEAEWLRDVSIEWGLPPDQLRRRLAYEKEKTARLQKVLLYRASELRAGREPDPERMRETMFGGNFMADDSRFLDSPYLAKPPKVSTMLWDSLTVAQKKTVYAEIQRRQAPAAAPATGPVVYEDVPVPP